MCKQTFPSSWGNLFTEPHCEQLESNIMINRFNIPYGNVQPFLWPLMRFWISDGFIFILIQVY